MSCDTIAKVCQDYKMILCTALYMLTLGNYFSGFADQVH